MKATGNVRHMDELSRVVIPREICEKLDIKPGVPLEVFTEDDKIVFRKFDASDGKEEAIETLQELLRGGSFDDNYTQVEKMMFDLLLKKIAEKG